MIKQIMLFIGLFASILSFSQKLDNYPFGNLDVNIMLMPFDMDYPIKIGTMSKSGEMQFDFPSELKNGPGIDTDGESTKLWYTLFSPCDYGISMVSETDDMFSFQAGNISLWTNDNRYVGVVFTLGTDELLPWVEDPSYMEPVIGSYYKLVYVDKAYEHKSECNQTMMLENGDAQIIYSYDLNLKAGLNFLEYKIEHIYKTDPNVMASFPDKIMVTSVNGIPNCKWIGKYF